MRLWVLHKSCVLAGYLWHNSSGGRKIPPYVFKVVLEASVDNWKIGAPYYSWIEVEIQALEMASTDTRSRVGLSGGERPDSPLDLLWHHSTSCGWIPGSQCNFHQNHCSSLPPSRDKNLISPLSLRHNHGKHLGVLFMYPDSPLQLWWWSEGWPQLFLWCLAEVDQLWSKASCLSR